ncbi:FG-GAP repeat domain-containing protein [Polyangium aurulentum]|uniref:FG-GAP repeat domain-containing protein n=1 Tax=Polyangium aurulentum TaxID=2567896 RepID=UPI0010AE7B84|nr:VCBS repeat-containing protein [Polyangium aurulentum]UQA54629.1 VCBS repeat-containing protein [Polyangium aurulentum]
MSAGLLAATCAPLPPLGTRTCGNAVIEAFEECDGHASEPGTHCAEPDEEHHCRFTCGGPYRCPTGFQCGRDRVCREPSGEFLSPETGERFASPGRLHIADFNVDGRPDVLLLGHADSYGRRPARLVYPSQPAPPTMSQVLPSVIGPTALGDVEGTEGSPDDIAFADDAGVALLFGHPNRSPEFAMFPTLALGDGIRARSLVLEVLPQSPGDEIVTLVDAGKAGASLSAPTFGGLNLQLTQLPAGLSHIVEPLAAGTFDESTPCPSVVVAYNEPTEVILFPLCRAGQNGIEWNVGGKLSSVTLPAGASIDHHGVEVADLDMDGHLDLIIGAIGFTYVAWGLGDGSFVSKKVDGAPNQAALYTLPSVGDVALSHPLAIGDLNADGISDLVDPRHVLMSGGPFGHYFAYTNSGVPWTEAVIADLNGNGLFDVAASSSEALDIDFLNNAGNGLLNHATLSTEGLVSHLAVGDFDGDLLRDLVFEEMSQKGEDTEERISVAFGSPFGPPAAMMSLGRRDDIQHITTGKLLNASGLDAIDEILATSQDADSDSFIWFTGQSSRIIYAPFPLYASSWPALPIALTFGNLGDGTPDVAALGVDWDTRELRLFRVEGYDDGPKSPLPSEPLSNHFHHAEVMELDIGPPNLRYGAVIGAGDLDEDGTDEVVVIAAFGYRWDGAAVVVADYDSKKAQLVPRPEQEFSAVLSADATLTMVDADGDTHVDALLTTGTADEPGPLLIFWGNGKGDLRVDAPTEVSPDGQGVRSVACMPSSDGKGCKLLLACATGTFSLVPGSGRKADASLVPSLPAARALGVADFNGDNLDDVAVLTEEGLDIYRSKPEMP